MILYKNEIPVEIKVLSTWNTNGNLSQSLKNAWLTHFNHIGFDGVPECQERYLEVLFEKNEGGFTLQVVMPGGKTISAHSSDLKTVPETSKAIIVRKP